MRKIMPNPLEARIKRLEGRVSVLWGILIVVMIVVAVHVFGFILNTVADARDASRSGSVRLQK